MRILIIGGTGFMGPLVVQRLFDMQHDITLFHTGRHEADLPPAVRHIHSDLGGLPITGLPAELRALQPDVVLHMAPVGARDAQLVMDAFRGMAGRVVGISSMDVYRAYGVLHDKEPGPLEPLPLTEDSPVRTHLYPYRASPHRPASDPEAWVDDYDKILVEQAILGDSSLHGTILRLAMVHGPGDRQHRLFKYLKRMQDGRQAILLNEKGAKWRGARGYVENIADAIALAATDERAAGRTYNVGEPDALSEAEWVAQIAAVVGWPGRIIEVPAHHLPLAFNPDQHLVADTTRIRSELGYTESVPRPEALRRTIAWEYAHPPDTLNPSSYDYAAEDVILTEIERTTA
ncbi:MAG TPA: NAD-dependent epimerase/dehydratase family protein [Chloroflexia bacterium]|nr:NAD-dependent epimerase/dehydratase family protein [Chloroflexia bacterium]